jgi:hypothetical protein
MLLGLSWKDTEVGLGEIEDEKEVFLSFLVISLDLGGRCNSGLEVSGVEIMMHLRDVPAGAYGTF